MSGSAEMEGARRAAPTMPCTPATTPGGRPAAIAAAVAAEGSAPPKLVLPPGMSGAPLPPPTPVEPMEGNTAHHVNQLIDALPQGVLCTSGYPLMPIH